MGPNGQASAKSLLAPRPQSRSATLHGPLGASTTLIALQSRQAFDITREEMALNCKLSAGIVHGGQPDSGPSWGSTLMKYPDGELAKCPHLRSKRQSHLVEQVECSLTMQSVCEEPDGGVREEHLTITLSMDTSEHDRTTPRDGELA